MSAHPETGSGAASTTPTTGGTVTVHAGRFVYPDGSTYEGEYAVIDGTKRKHGKGKYTDSHASYQGEWEADKMHGKGIYIAASGATYDGEFVLNTFQGTGTYRWPDGAEYRGTWRQNKMHGDGAYTGPDGLQFVGTFYNGLYVEGNTHVSVR